MDHPYDDFTFHDNTVDLTNASVFFQSLELAPSMTGKAGAHRPKLDEHAEEHPEHAGYVWIDADAGVAVQHAEVQTFEMFETIDFVHSSTVVEEREPQSIDENNINNNVVDVHDEDIEVEEVEKYDVYENSLIAISEDEDEDEDDSSEDYEENTDEYEEEDDEDDDGMVPRIGGKWKPPELLSENDNSEDPDEDIETNYAHPPAGYTKGKWVPGAKVQRLEYKEEVILAQSKKETHWCKICSRELKTKTLYKNHLKTRMHLKKARVEQQLEKAVLQHATHGLLYEKLTVQADNQVEVMPPTKKQAHKPASKRTRQTKSIKCALCDIIVQRHNIGKHLTSHYHFSKLNAAPKELQIKSYEMILDNMHSIVAHSPFQCLICSFYCNTEDAFLQHWLSRAHINSVKYPGKFLCNHCNFGCARNEQMLNHLIGPVHKNLVAAVNRSVPISIGKISEIKCSLCDECFRYNIQLRHHKESCHPDEMLDDTAADEYQNRFECEYCSSCFYSAISMQRHLRQYHKIERFFCNTCNLNFKTSLEAIRHRKTALHRRMSARIKPYEISKSMKKHRVSTSSVCPKVEELLIPSSPKECVEESIATLNALQIIEPIPAEQSLLPSVLIACTESDFVQKEKKDPVLENVSIETHLEESQLMMLEIKLQPDVTTDSGQYNASRRMLKCSICKEVFATRKELINHKENKHPLNKHICPICGASFAISQSLSRHAGRCRIQPSGNKSPRANNDSALFNCLKCNFSSEYKSELLYHDLYHENPLGIKKSQRIKCPCCAKMFTKYALRNHLRLHTGELNFDCDICGKDFYSDRALKQHQIRHGMEAENENRHDKVTNYQRKANCNDLATNSILEKHQLNMHSDDYKLRFACNIQDCTYIGNTESDLKIHMNTHGNVHGRGFRCPYIDDQQMQCKYVGTSQHHVNRHHRMRHTEVRMLYCNHCDFKTGVSSHMTRHIAVHSDKRIKCPYCDFRCRTNDALRKHILKTNIHKGKSMYSCQCGFESNFQTPFKEHMNRCVLKSIEAPTGE